MSPEGELLDRSRAVYERHRPVEVADDLVCSAPDCGEPWPCEAMRRAKAARQEALKN